MTLFAGYLYLSVAAGTTTVLARSLNARGMTPLSTVFIAALSGLFWPGSWAVLLTYERYLLHDT